LSMSLDGFYYGHSATPFQPFNCCPEIYSADFVSVMSGTDRLRPLQDCLRTAPSDVLSRMLYIDGRTWLPDDLLLKADKMTMANSVELRVPFLDHHLLEFAASLPSDDKIKHLTTKYALRQALCPLLPAPIRKRKKAGFPVPYAAWLRFDLRDWIDGIVLDPSSLARGYFRPDPLEHLLAKNARSGKFSREVFSLAVLELWHRQFLPALPRRAGEQAPADEIWTVAA
ncbi:MAG TPA: asparagine synthase C-terminal domain-containing protein, partial [Terriglobales bacterium]|nr:asparagine synthase C-terminal domain-containing protein [Terriglobales bacterium]